MNAKLKKLTSVCLAIIMILGVLTIAPISVSAADTNKNIFTNTYYTDKISTYNEIDVFNFSVSNPSKVSINVQHNLIDSSSSYWNFKLCNINGDELINFDSLGNKTNSTSCNTGIPKGNYYIKVSRGSYRSNIDYTFKVNCTSSSVWETETNDSYDEADSINLNTYYYGTINKAYYDYDYYKFSVSNPSKVSINVQHNSIDSSSSYWNFKLCNMNGDELINFDSLGNKTNSTSCNTGIPKGNYYIKVSRGSYHSNIDYTFKVNCTSSSVWETETNDSYDEADSINLNTYYYGTINKAYYDYDYYKFSVSNPSKVSIDVKHNSINSSSSYWNFKLCNMNGDELINFYSLGDKTSSTSNTVNLSSGKYYIKVSRGSYHSNIDYSFSINTNSSTTTAPTSVSVSPSSLALNVDGTYTLTKSVYPSNALTSYTWSSSNTSVATVDSNGKITAKKAGTATITVKTSNCKTATCKVTVTSSIPTPTITKLENTSSGIKITWNKVAGAYGYRLYYKYPGKDWKSFKDTTATSFTDTGVSVGRTETYTICCIDKNGNTISGYNSSGWSKNYQPVAPTITKLENTASGIKISWNKVVGVYGYRLYYKYPGKNWKSFKDTTATSFTDTGVSAGRTEIYTICCIDKNGNTISGYNSSGWSKNYQPVAPTITKLENTANGIKISWNKVAGVYGYRLYYKYPGKDWKRFKDTTDTTFTDTGVSAGRTETYTIRCIDKNGNTISGYYLNGWSKKYEPVAPTISKLDNTSNGVKISWNKVAGVYGYRLYYKYPGQDWKRFKDTTSTSFTDAGVKSGRTETYTIRCIDKDGNTISGYNPSGWSITYR